jgi:hypothetical protein
MRIKSFLRRLVGGGASTAVIKVVPTETQKVVAVLLTLPIAEVARDAILSLAHDSHSGQQKFGIVLSLVLPGLVDLIGGKGMTVPAGDVEDIAREFVQAVYNQVASPRAKLVARILLALFKVL